MSKTLEESAKGVKKAVDNVEKATGKASETANKGFDAVIGRKSVILDNLTNIGSSKSANTVGKVLNVGVSGATTATVGNQLITAIKGKNLLGVTDAMAKGATSVNDLLLQLNVLVPAIPQAQLPTQITNSIGRLKNGKDVYDAAKKMLTALVVDASGQMTFETVSSFATHFNDNWDTFSAKIDALFQVTPGNGQQAVLETVGKSLFDENVFNAAGVIKRQVPGVMSGIVGIKDSVKQFGGSYKNPIEAATKIRGGVEKMVQSIEKISQSLNEMVKFYQRNVLKTSAVCYPLLDTLGALSGTKGIKILDTALRIGGGAAAVAGNAESLTQAIKNKDVKGAIASAKKAFDDFSKLTKKGNYEANKLIANSGNTQSGNTSKTSSNSVSVSTNRQQTTSQQASAQSDSYVCSGAMMKCSMGTSQAKLTVLPTRTVYLTGQPMANISDHLTMVNLAPFGKCRSMNYPATASATAANQGRLTPMPCMHNTPLPWMSGKNDYLVKGDLALLKSSTCSCMWGGTISLVTDGQNPTGLIDMSRQPRDIF